MTPKPGRAGKLRIAVLSRNFSPAAGGAERYAIALVEELAARHEIHVFSQTIGHHWPGVTYHRVSMPLRKPRWINQFWFAAATWWKTRAGFDIVHSHENTWHGNVQTVHVLPVRYTLFQGRTGMRRGLRWLKVITSPRLLAYLLLERMRYLPRRGRAVVVISPSLQKIFSKTYPAADAITSLITPGINLPANKPPVLARQEARAELGLPQGVPCLLFIANDFRKKGLGTLIKAMARLPAETVLAVVGSLAQLPDFRRQAEQSAVHSRVFFLGPLADVSLAYRAANCLVHPTLEDTFAMVVLEAMAHRLPVIVSGPAYCGISGLLEDGVQAMILQDPKDVQALAVCLQRVLADAAFSNQLGKRARNFAEGFEWTGVADRQEQLYRSVAKSGAV